jgi:hypothetical protein
MRRNLLTAAGLTTMVLGCLAVFYFEATGQQPPTPDPKQPAIGPALPAPDSKYPDFNKMVAGAKEYDGLFKLHHKDDRLFMEIRPDQFERPFLCPMAIARGMGMGGHTLNYDEQWVLVFRRVGDKVHLIRRNVRFQAKSGTPAARAVETTYTDSVLLALRIQTINQMRQNVVIDLNDIFLTNFAQLNLGPFDPSRSTWHKIKAFRNNIEVEVAATFGGGRGGESVIDGRGTTVVLHYGLAQLPDSAYHPRLADDRVGYFLTVVKDFSNDSRDTPFVRYVNRWRLDRAEPLDPKNPNKLSAPKKKIVFWIEKSVPDEYRAYVREGILEWNKAFEKIGFRDAIEVRQQENEDFDPEDISYATFRWITSDRGFAMGPSRVNPLTGEILDADIIFDASMVRFWRGEHVALGPKAEPASLILAGRQGWGLLDHPLFQLQAADNLGWNEPRKGEALSLREQAQLWALRQGACQCGSHKHHELGLAAMLLTRRDQLKPGDKVPEELIGQAIKETVMHEVGHTLGLRHNFKASTMLKHDQLHDTALTRKQGLAGSVMDYNPVNLAPKGVKQGDYFSTTIGPYDYWAIEYGYKPLTGGTEGEVEKLQEIAARCAQPGLDYGTDEDLYSAPDPLINQWDLGSDPMKFAQERMLLAEELLKELADRVVDKGEGYQRARQAFGLLLRQYGDAAHLTANFVGGLYVHRDHRGDPNGRDPFVPVKGDKQREALKFLQEHILTDRAFQFSPQLLRRLAADRWSHWGNYRGMTAAVEYPIHDRIMAIQRVVLGQLLDGQALRRIQNNALAADKGEEPLTIAEVFRSLTDGTWTELPNGYAKDGKRSLPSSVVRRNLQREHIKDLSTLVLGPKSSGGFFSLFGGDGGPAPPDARSLARLHLREINKRIDDTLKDKAMTLDDTTRAHLEECQERIAKVLSASVQVNE